jgi:hypothetical protein
MLGSGLRFTQPEGAVSDSSGSIHFAGDFVFFPIPYRCPRVSPTAQGAKIEVTPVSSPNQQLPFGKQHHWTEESALVGSIESHSISGTLEVASAFGENPDGQT